MIRLTPIPWFLKFFFRSSWRVVHSARRLTRCRLHETIRTWHIDLGQRWCENVLTHTRPPSAPTSWLQGELGPISRSVRRVERSYDRRTKY